MKNIPKDKLKQLVSEKGYSVTRGEKPKQEKPSEQKPQIVQIPDKETVRIVIASAEVVVNIAKTLDSLADKLNKAVQSLEKLASQERKIEIIEKDSKPKEHEYTIVRDHSGSIQKLIKKEI